MSLLLNAFGVLYEREAGGRPAPGFFARLDAGLRIPFHGWVERRMAYWGRVKNEERSREWNSGHGMQMEEKRRPFEAQGKQSRRSSKLAALP
jgi:hypothetical protein